jgi:hypothetical protein
MIYGSFSSIVEVENLDSRHEARQALPSAKTAVRERIGNFTVEGLAKREATEKVDRYKGPAPTMIPVPGTVKNEIEKSSSS